MQADRQEINSHPLLYRQAVNERRRTTNDTIASENTSKICTAQQPSIKPPSQDHTDHWDCYPNLIRQIENHGSPTEVRKLHAMEKNCNR
jgi:hypothetical protein